ncbi:MAG: tetratricopeptide repeat protein [Bacteroidales bacterium]|nr:tetratricopeptide repeat protein [Bacteroidales bacterium]
MRKIAAVVLVLFCCSSALAQYSDHRGHNTDSLEKVVAGWTPEKISLASDGEIDGLLTAYKDLMWGYLQINRERSMMFARKTLALSQEKGYWFAYFDAAKVLGMHYYAAEQWDSAIFYYNKSLDAIKTMEGGATTPQHPEGYPQSTIDDAKSTLYGALGNMYNMMDSIPKAMDYYKKAGEIFDKYGWKESNAILWYNMGETWLDEGDYSQAEECYNKSLGYARESGDSLQISSPLKGLGALYLAQGKTSRALKCLEEADKYYSLHEDQEFRARLETLDVMRKVLLQQKKQLRWLFCGALCLVALMIALMLYVRRNALLRRKSVAADEVIEEAISVMEKTEGNPSGQEVDLTEREHQILQLISQGKTSPQIAEKMYLSLPTIKWYRKKLLSKFEASTAAELVIKAKEKGLF